MNNNNTTNPSVDAVYYETVDRENEPYEQFQDRHVNTHNYDVCMPEVAESDANVPVKTQSAVVTIRRNVAYAACAVFFVVCFSLWVVVGVLIFKSTTTGDKTLEEDNLKDVKTHIGGWSSWSKWGDCPVTCGCGYKTRTRSCDNVASTLPGYCDGKKSSDKICCDTHCKTRLGAEDDWLVMFRAMAYNQADLENAWFGGINTTSVYEHCFQSWDGPSCNIHYRHPFADKWKDIDIKEVKYALYKNKFESAYVVFNGSGSDMENWFSEYKILQSSWKYITQYINEPHEKRDILFIRGCEMDRNSSSCSKSWTITSTVPFGQGESCFGFGYPEFWYVGPDKYYTTDTCDYAEMKQADSMAISIRTSNVENTL